MMRTTIAALAATLALASPALAQQCGGDFSAWKAQMAQEATAAGVGQSGLAALEGAQIDQAVLQADRSQGVFTQTFTEFAGRMINSYRLKNGAADRVSSARRSKGVKSRPSRTRWPRSRCSS